MVALHSLTAASTLLQQITSGMGSATPKTDAASSVAQAVAGVSSATGSATKSVSSAIFNAVAASSEKQDKAIEAVLDYIDREYTNIEKSFPSIVKIASEDPSVNEAIARHKEAGQKLKENILSDPARAYAMMEQIKSARPDVSNEGAMLLMLADIGKSKN